jgi:hypothetical protein
MSVTLRMIICEQAFNGFLSMGFDGFSRYLTSYRTSGSSIFAVFGILSEESGTPNPAS